MSDLILARKAVLSKRDDSILEVHGEWAFMIKSAVDEQNSEGLRMCNREYLGFQIHPESEKFVNARFDRVEVDKKSMPKGVKVDADGYCDVLQVNSKGDYYLLVIGAQGKQINDEAIAIEATAENEKQKTENKPKTYSK